MSWEGAARKGVTFLMSPIQSQMTTRDQAGDASARTRPGLCTLNIEEYIFLTAT